MSELGIPTVPPADAAGAVIPAGNPPLSPEARQLQDQITQNFVELTNTHNATLEAFGVEIHAKWDPVVTNIKTSLKDAAETIKDQQVSLDRMQAELESRATQVPTDRIEAEADRLWGEAFNTWIRTNNSFPLPEKQRKFMAASNEWVVAEAKREATAPPVAFDPVNAVSAGGLTTDFGPGAGVWARPTFERNVTRQLIEFTPIRQFARVIPIGGAQYIGVIRNTNRETIEQIQESATPTQQTQKNRYEERPIVPFEYFARPALSRVSIEDSVIPLEAEVRNDAVFDFAVDEASNFINGSGANAPHGYAVDANVTGGVTSRTASTLDHYDLTNLAMSLRPFYRNSTSAAYALSTDALTDAMLEEDGFGRRLWQPSNQEGVPSILNGWRYFEATEQASVATAAKPAFFANWDMFYRIVDRRGMLIIRDEVTEPGLVILNMSRRYGGRTWLVEAGAALTIA